MHWYTDMKSTGLWNVLSKLKKKKIRGKEWKLHNSLSVKQRGSTTCLKTFGYFGGYYASFFYPPAITMLSPCTSSAKMLIFFSHCSSINCSNSSSAWPTALKWVCWDSLASNLCWVRARSSGSPFSLPGTAANMQLVGVALFLTGGLGTSETRENHTVTSYKFFTHLS